MNTLFEIEALPTLIKEIAPPYKLELFVNLHESIVKELVGNLLLLDSVITKAPPPPLVAEFPVRFRNEEPLMLSCLTSDMETAFGFVTVEYYELFRARVDPVIKTWLTSLTYKN